MTDLDESEPIHQPRLWRDHGWTARVIKNNDDEGWAVEMIRQGEPEPALVGPWTMGRDKKNPKPLDIVPDEDDPHALLAASDMAGERLAQWRVAASFKLSAAGAQDWVEAGLLKPR